MSVFGLISSIFHLIIYNPLYNGLILLIDVIPRSDVGLAIVLFTVFVKLVLFPLSQKAVRTQIKTKELQPEVDKIKEKYKDDKQKQAEKMLSLYRENNMNPLSGIVVLFIQIPIILALYYIFLRGGLPSINQDILYSFIPTPEKIDIMFLGLINVSGKSIFVSILVGISQFIQVRYSNPIKESKKDEKKTFQNDLMKSMRFQLKYVLPVMIAFISYTLSVGVSLYWITNNLFMIGQEVYVRRKNKKEENV